MRRRGAAWARAGTIRHSLAGQGAPSMIPLNVPRPFAANALWYMVARCLLAVLLLIVIAFVFQLGAAAPGASCSGALCGRVSGNQIAGFLYLYGALLLAGAVLKFRSSSFVLTDKSISVASGIFFQNSSTIRFERIQDVATRRDPLLMLLGLTAVAIWTASPDQRIGKSKRPDGLVILDSADADWLKNYLAEPGTAPGVPPGTPADASATHSSVLPMLAALGLATLIAVAGVILWRKPSVPAVDAAALRTTAIPAPTAAAGDLRPHHAKRHVVAASPAAAAATQPVYAIACAIRSGAGAAVAPCAELDQAQRCQHESDFGSAPTAEAADLTVANRSAEEVKFFWLDRRGGRSLYATLPPGGQVTQQSHVGAHWLVATDDGRCIGIFNAATTSIGVF
jgi:membrane protein YdbS with pleckstrin-like domain